MVVKYLGDGEWSGLSTDTKPTNAAVGDLYKSTNTRELWIHTGGGTWVEIDYIPPAPSLPNVIPPAFFVYRSGTDYVTRNGITGVESTTANAAAAIQFAFDNLTAARTWKECVALKGDFTFPTIAIPSYTVLDLTQARLLQVGGTNDNFIRNSDTTNGNTDIEIVGGIIDGNKAAQSAGGTEDSQSMVWFKKCSRVWLHHGTYQNGDFHNIFFRECPADIKVTEITSYDPRHEHLSSHAQALAQGACRGHVFANSYFENITAGNSHITTINISDCVIANNVCKKTFDTTSCITPNGVRSIVIGNTVIDGSGTGIILAQSASAAYNANDSIVANNIVKNCASYAIVSNGQAISGLVITGNRIDGGGGSQSAGIYLALSEGCVVSNNVVSNRGGNGIYVVGSSTLPSKRNKVIGNVCYNNGQGLGGGNHQAGIQLLSLVASGDVSYITVEDNQCYDLQGVKTQLYGIRISNATNCIIRDNDVRDNATAGYNTAGTNTGTLAGSNIGALTANADTSGATLAALETEVNELKATLRAAGLIG